ncbi:MAG: flippase-like domain-containing protein [Gammaproteobacteria bacterium]|nr:flippase-like domain-containing protein [Gammaproteobacteria bacterium]
MTDIESEEKLSFKWSWLIRIIITAVLLTLIFRNIEFKSVKDIILHADIQLLILAILFQLLSTLLAGYRWGRVMKALNFGQKSEFYMRSYFKGSFFNQGLPTSIGGDAVRVLDVATKGHRKRDAFIGVFIDRILGLSGLLILNLVANYFLPGLLPENLFLMINVIVLAGLLGFITFIYIHKIKALHKGRLLSYILRVSKQLNRILHDLRSISFHLVIGVLIHLFSIINIYLVGQSVGLEYDLLTIAVIVPPVILLTLIPVSLAGWGIREGAMVGLFGLIGGVAANILSMSILYGIILIISSLPGLYTYLHRK